MSLRWRWALTLAAVAVVAVGLVAVTAAALTARTLRAEVDRTLQERVESLGRVPLRDVQGRLPRRGNGPSVLRSLLGADLEVQVLDPGGEVVFSLGDGPDLPVAQIDREIADGGEASIRTVEVDGERFRMVTAPIRNGAVQLARDLARTDALLGTLVRRFLLVGVVAAGVAAAAGAFLAGRAVRPIQELTRSAEHVSRTGDLTAPMTEATPDEVGRLAASFTAMISALKESREQQRRLVADAGHELRTPLTGLRTDIEVLRRRPDLPAEERRELVSAALVEVDRLGRLVGELVDLAGDARLSPETPVRERLDVLAGAVTARYSRILDRPIHLTGDGEEVSVRPTQFERAVGNLLDNAAKWSPPDAPIDVEVADRTLTVRDRGPGIDHADLPRVFERFYRSADARAGEGSGLGLAIVRQAVEANGGEVFARNHPDGGAEVGFRLPAP